MESLADKSLPKRLWRLAVSLGGVFVLVYVFLPLLNDSVDVLGRMAATLEESGIDPSRYYYTDVEQVQEAEHYMRSVVDGE